jgi:hypothetical protein
MRFLSRNTLQVLGQSNDEARFWLCNASTR